MYLEITPFLNLEAAFFMVSPYQRNLLKETLVNTLGSLSPSSHPPRLEATVIFLLTHHLSSDMTIC